MKRFNRTKESRPYVSLVWTQSCGLFKDIEQSLGAKHAVAASSADLLNNVHLGKASQSGGCSIVSDAEMKLRLAHGDEWIRGEHIEQVQRYG